MPSHEAMAIRQMLSQYRSGEHEGPPPSIEMQRAALDEMGRTIPQPDDVIVTQTNIAGVHGEWIEVKGVSSSRVILYLHGGAYYMGSCESHRSLCWRLARAAKARVLLIEYRLAPEHKFPAAVEDAVDVYKELIRDGGITPACIAIAGDSAGGGLTAAILLSLRDANVDLPACAILLSPWTDLAGTGESMTTRAKYDPWLEPNSIRKAPALYTAEETLTHPLASPLYADLQGLPPLLIHVGDHECLLDDSVRYADKARAAGVSVTLHIWEEMWHVFQSFPMPEADAAIAEIGRFVQQQIPD
ncbi:hydrolase [Alicyclobacillus hesperidum subsp. aegles]|uniref:alpha/beta hydrolase n=1 Tax=Alicyclobacillus hesperidum TaxID=89784 RepID=UPI00222A9E03|nr:alpha/beta hydrolase [Alicyclobacillus hesperidum]GLF99988.1 hydrolase [Alicyclobacillus hesperidum subsp. aegles]